jgi:hypothetical protein
MQATPRITDFASCVLIEPKILDDFSDVSEGRVYSASVAGTFKPGGSHICAGTIVEAKLADLAMED